MICELYLSKTVIYKERKERLEGEKGGIKGGGWEGEKEGGRKEGEKKEGRQSKAWMACGQGM